jgi:uncharacterized protein involved in tolerance to divalent cations
LYLSNLATSIQISEVSSVYDWEGKLKKAKEFLLLIKGQNALFPKLQECLLANHTYEFWKYCRWMSPMAVRPMSLIRSGAEFSRGARAFEWII